MSKEFPTINKESPSINREATIIYRGHNDNVFTVAWSPDGKYIASGSRDKTVRIWDVATVAPRFIVGDSLFIYRGHNKCVLSAAWSPGHGGYIASGGDYGDSTAQVWQAFTGKHIYTHDQQYRIFSVAWAPDLSASSFNPSINREPTWIASSSFDGSVQVWQVPHGNSSEYKLFSYHAHSGPVYALSWSPGGAHIVSGGQDAILRIWNVARSESASGTGSIIRTYNGHTRPVKAVAWSPDGNHIASGGDDMTIQVWEAATAKHVATYSGHTSWVRALDWSPDGKRIVSASGNALHIWRTDLAQVV